MSHVNMASKTSLSHVWPINRKRFLVVVNPHSAQWTTSIEYLIGRGAKVIVLPTFGNVAGVPMQTSPHVSDMLFKAWTSEEGRGLTSLFYSLDENLKLRILKSIEGVTVPSTAAATKGTGKTPFFAQLPLDVKYNALALHGVLAAMPDKATAAPFVDILATIVNVGHVTFVADPLHAGDRIAAMAPRDIILLENLRYYGAEVSTRLDDQRAFASVLAAYGDVFVNDAFVESYRVLASTSQLPVLLRHGACGLVMDGELHAFASLLAKPCPPMAVIVGGSDAARGVALISSLLATVQVILVGGLVSLPFLAARGGRVGRELPKDLVALAAATLESAAARGTTVVLPVDHTVAIPTAKWLHITPTADVPPDGVILDVGPATVQVMAKALRGCRMIVWVGALGKLPDSATGTLALAHTFQTINAIKIAGGAALVSTLKQQPQIAAAFTHFSTGSVAVLALLRDKAVPGVEPLSSIADVSGGDATIHQLLCSVPLLAGCSGEQRHRIALKAVRLSYEVGDVLVWEGTRYTGLWVVSTGSLILERTDAPPLGPGSALGQYECFSLAPAAATVRVVEQGTVAYFVSHTAFHEIISEYPDVGLQLIATLCTSISTVSGGLPSAPARTASALQRVIASSSLPFSPSAPVTSTIAAVVTAAASEFVLLPLTAAVEPFMPQSRSCLVARSPLGRSALRVGLAAAGALLYRTLMAAWRPTTPEARALAPFAASAVTAAVTSPFRRLATGAPLSIFCSTAAAQATLDAVLSLIPLLAQLLQQRWALMQPAAFDSDSAIDARATSLPRRALCQFLVALQLWFVARHRTGMQGPAVKYAARSALRSVVQSWTAAATNTRQLAS